MPLPTLAWTVDAATGHLVLLDQTRLPLVVHQHDCRRLEDVVESIQSLRVRGAPAIGVAAAYGVVIGLQPFCEMPPAIDDLASGNQEMRRIAPRVSGIRRPLRLGQHQKYCGRSLLQYRLPLGWQCPSARHWLSR